MRYPLVAIASISLAGSSLIGCGSPNKVNVALRKKNQDLQQQVDQLKQQHAGDLASLATTMPGMARPAATSEQLGTLFTVTSIKLNDRFTGLREPGLKVYVVPTDAAGDPLKSAGSFSIDAFDLSDKDKPLLGHWDFPVSEAGHLWQQSALFAGYILPCPLSSKPPSAAATTAEVTVKVTFVDGLTQRALDTQTVIKPAK